MLEQLPRKRSSLYRSFQHWRSRSSNEEFSVVDGRVYLQQTAGARDPFVILRLFTFVARHGVALSVETERRLVNARRGLADTMPQDSRLWEHLREILVLPYAADALRAMHSLGLLTLAIPEFEAIDSLVLRDLYHRYTVDEHSILAIEMLHRLTTNSVEWLQPFAGLLTELERPELLFLALLLHDTGKGMEGDDHVHNSLQLAAAAVERMGLEEEDESDGRPIDRHSSGDVVHVAPPRHLRSRNRARTGAQSRHPGAAEDADAADPGRHQVGQSRRAHSVEGGKPLAPVRRLRPTTSPAAPTASDFTPRSAAHKSSASPRCCPSAARSC